MKILGNAHVQSSKFASAKDFFEQSRQIFHALGNQKGESGLLLNLGAVDARHIQAYALTRLGHALAGMDRLAEAAAAYQHALDLRRALGQQNLAMESLAGLARVALTQGNHTRAQTYVEEILMHLQAHNLDGTDEPFRIYLTCYRVLRATRDARAKKFLRAAQQLLHERAARLGDETTRRMFLENVPHHRELSRVVE